MLISVPFFHVTGTTSLSVKYQPPSLSFSFVELSVLDARNFGGSQDSTHEEVGPGGRFVELSSIRIGYFNR